MPLYLAEVQLHAGDLGQADRKPRGSPGGRQVVRLVSRREAPRFLVLLRSQTTPTPSGRTRTTCPWPRSRSPSPVAGPLQLPRNDGPPDRGGHHRCAAQG